MATTKVSVSSRRIAQVDVLPCGANYPIYVQVYAIRFHDTDTTCRVQVDEIGMCCAVDPEQLWKILKCFGIDWSEAADWEDAVEMISEDYEERKAKMNATYGKRG